jgi:hypothetical protein
LAAGRAQVSFLDELKKQADALQSRQQVDEETFLRNARAADAATKATFHYWLDLARQLNVLRPPVPARYAFDNRHALDGPADGLKFDDFRVDARRKQLRGFELYDHAVIGCWVRSGRRLVIDKDFPPEMQRLEAKLAQAGIVAPSTALRDDATGRFVAARYEFDADVRVGVRLAPDHERGVAQFTVNNFEALESMVVEFAADAVGEPLLDELAKWWLGEPNGFVAAGRIVRIVDPR